MTSAEYISQVKANGNPKRFDLIHMIQVLTQASQFFFCQSLNIDTYNKLFFIVLLASFQDEAPIYTVYLMHSINLASSFTCDLLRTQMIYYVEDLVDTISFYHGLLKNNGRLLIVLAARKFIPVPVKGDSSCVFCGNRARLLVHLPISLLYIPHLLENSGTNILQKAFCRYIPETHSFAGVISCLQDLGLRYEEHLITNSTDIADCFGTSNQNGKRMLSFMTGTNHFQESFMPEVREDMLEFLRKKCSTEQDGRIFYNSDLTCIVVYS